MRQVKLAARIWVLCSRKLILLSIVPRRDNYLAESNLQLKIIPISFTCEGELFMKQSILQHRDGFFILVEEFALPADSWNLDPQSKRAVTICNLFVNHRYSISDVVRVLDEDLRNVVQVLLKKGIIRDGRVLGFSVSPSD